MQASASMPLAAKIVKIGHYQLLDGGVADSIPVRFFESIGYKRNLIILTQPKGFVKQKNKMLPLIRARYVRYPAFVEAVADRHQRYNETLAYISMLEQSGRPSSSARPSRWRFPLWSATPPSCAACTRPAVPWHRSRSTRSQPMWRSARLHRKNNTKGCCTGLCGSLFYKKTIGNALRFALGIFSGKIFLLSNPGKSADFPGLHFHEIRKRPAPCGADLLMFKKER